MLNLKITQAAKVDVLHIIDWYNHRQENFGYKFLEELNLNLKIIQKNPQAFPVKYPPYHEVILRHFPCIITYIVYKKDVIIKSVMGAKQHPSKKYRA